MGIQTLTFKLSDYLPWTTSGRVHVMGKPVQRDLGLETPSRDLELSAQFEPPGVIEALEGEG